MFNKRIFAPKSDTSFRLFVVLLLLFTSVYCGTIHILKYKQGQNNLKFAVALMQKKSSPLLDDFNISDKLEYKRVTMTGGYLHDKGFLIEVSDGYNLIVPFKRISGSVVMVNRGYVSREGSKHITHPNGIIMLEGILNSLDSYPEQYKLSIKDIGYDAGVRQFLPFVLSLVEINNDNYPSGAKVNIKTNDNDLRMAEIFYGYALFVLFLIFLSERRYIIVRL